MLRAAVPQDKSTRPARVDVAGTDPAADVSRCSGIRYPEKATIQGMKKKIPQTCMVLLLLREAQEKPSFITQNEPAKVQRDAAEEN
jgi:hypothetical protein